MQVSNSARLAALVLGMFIASPLAAQDDAVPRPAKVFTVQPSPKELVLTYPASVLPSTEVELSFRVSGQVIDLPIRGSMSVAEGDLIAALDPRDFETQVAQLEAEIDQANAQLSALRSGARAEEIVALEAAVASAEAQLTQAREQAERTRELEERGVVATARLDEDEAALRVAEANLQTQIEQLEIGRAGGRAEDIEASEAAIRGLEAQLQVARNNLNYATLEAPFSGIIARRDIDAFTNVQAGQPVALLQALAIVHMAFDVPGPDVTKLTVNGPDQITNKVTFDALPGQIFDAETVEFSVQADSATQTYRGRVAVEVPPGSFILPGMVGRVVTSVPVNGDVLSAPLTAVGAASDGSPIVWMLGTDNSVSPRAVTLGDAEGDMVIVTEGLTAGDTIVSAGVGQLIDGMVVRPTTQIGG